MGVAVRGRAGVRVCVCGFGRARVYVLACGLLCLGFFCSKKSLKKFQKKSEKMKISLQTTNCKLQTTNYKLQTKKKLKKNFKVEKQTRHTHISTRLRAHAPTRHAHLRGPTPTQTPARPHAHTPSDPHTHAPPNAATRTLLFEVFCLV